MENQVEHRKEHLAQARKINFDYDIARSCIRKTYQAIESGDVKNVQYWRLSFRALLDLDGSWNCEALEEDILVRTLGLLAIGPANLEEYLRWNDPTKFKDPDFMDCSNIDDDVVF